MSFDSSFWVMVSFLLFVGMLFYFRVPSRAIGALDQRAENIGKELQEAKELRQEAQNLLASYRRKQKEAESETEEILAQANREAERLVAESREEMVLQSERQLAMTEARIHQSEMRAKAELRSMAVSVAVDAARRVLQEQATQAPSDASLEESIRTLSHALPEGLARARDV